MRRLLLICGLLLPVLSCQDDPYTLHKLTDAGGGDMFPDMLGACDLSNGGYEICDGKDNDCDGLVDEAFNFATSVDHCGKCNNTCRLPGAITVCELRSCKFKGCAPGFFDIDMDLSQGWTSKSTGCEYACTVTNTTELCDGKDNDCNGKTDETFTLSTDVLNCGKCGNACQLANAVVKCDNGACKVQSCKAGYINKDKLDSNGCEWPCITTGPEICDGLDNDCNGVVDDPGGKVIDFKTDPLNCGGCGALCALPNAVTNCVSSVCVFTGCKPGGWVNANNDPNDGCECQYKGQEVCDGADNDCDGKIDLDSAAKPLGRSCYSGPTGTQGKGPCKAGSQTCGSGLWGSCLGQVTPKAEFCDNTDTDCDNVPDPPACLFAGTGRERRLDQPGLSVLGANNSAQLTSAVSGDRIVAAWVDRRNNRSDIFGNVSLDGAKSWQAADKAIATETTNSKLQPRILFGGGSGGSQRVYLVYQRMSDPIPGKGIPGVRDIFLRRSDNAATSWGGPRTIKNQSTVDTYGLQAVVIPGISDKILACWVQIAVSGALTPDVWCSMSVDNGQTFKAPVKVNDVSGTVLNPRIAVDASYLYVVMEDSKKGILVDRSPVGGTNIAFSADVTLSSTLGRRHQVLADGTGRVFVVWEEEDKTKNQAVMSNASKNYGGSWLTAAKQVDLDVVDGDSTNPVIAAWPGGRVVVAWTDSSRGQPDVYAGYSDDGGTTWSNPVSRVSGSTAGLNKSSSPHVAVDPTNKNVYVAWRDFRFGGNGDVFFSISMDQGKTWNVPDYRINESPKGDIITSAPTVLPATSRVAVLWSDFRHLNGGNLLTGPKADIYSTYLE